MKKLKTAIAAALLLPFLAAAAPQPPSKGPAAEIPPEFKYAQDDSGPTLSISDGIVASVSLPDSDDSIEKIARFAWACKTAVNAEVEIFERRNPAPGEDLWKLGKDESLDGFPAKKDMDFASRLIRYLKIAKIKNFTVSGALVLEDSETLDERRFDAGVLKKYGKSFRRTAKDSARIVIKPHKGKMVFFSPEKAMSEDTAAELAKALKPLGLAPFINLKFASANTDADKMRAVAENFAPLFREHGFHEIRVYASSDVMGDMHLFSVSSQ